MKSRNLLNTQPTDSATNGTKGLLAVRSPRGDVAGGSVARRFELRYNASPRFAHRRQERRQGQALLLAVLIMLLAALLSAVFLAVVSGNLNQSARIADKTRAIEASRTGIAFANAQLSGSSQGDLWRPIDVNPASIPVPANANYDFYYSQLDKVQGWASTLVPPTDTTDPNYQRDLFRYRNDTYGKFPDPNQPSGDAPKFLVKVEELPIDPNDIYYDKIYNPGHPYDAEHAGEIKITSIGLSDDDPNVFHRSIAYKNGRKKSPWASALRSVSNWNFGINNTAVGVPYAKVAATPYTLPPSNYPATTVDVSVETRIGNDDAPRFSPDDVPFNVVIVKKTMPSSVTGAVVTKVVQAPNSPTAVLTLAKLDNDLTPAPNETIVIQKAAAIGIGSSIDLLNTGTPVAYASDLPQPNGILTNGSVWLQGQIGLSNLNKFGTKLFTSGSLAIDGAKQVSATGDIATAGELLPSSANTGASQFPGTFVTSQPNSSAPNYINKLDLVSDGWNKIGAQTLGLDYSNSRDVEPFKPAKLDSAQNLARYRALTRNSDTDSNGYKAGVYIDNRDDVEKVGTAPMTQKQLVDMLMSSASYPLTDTEGKFYTRNSPAATAGTVGSSLEQKHLRGWVGPDEFLARGALVEISSQPDLNGNAPSLRVTLDARGDSTTATPNNDSGPDANKTVRDPNGNLQPGVYTEILPWPRNGTLFAEGNIRIRGKVDLSSVPVASAANFPSLTVASLGNIYIEGSVSVDGPLLADGVTPNTNRKKLMLMAKKNVVVNPTRLVLGHVDAQTVATALVNVAPGTNVGLPIAVGDSSDFRVGDKITLATTPAVVTAITSATQMEVAATNGTIVPIVVPANSPVKLAQWKDDYTQAAPYFKVDVNNSINRRVLLQDAGTTYPDLRLDLDHAGSRPATGTNAGFNIKTVDENTTKPTGLVVKVTNKRVDSNGTVDARKPIIERDEKKLRAIYNLPTPAGVDEFRDPALPAFTSETDAQTFSLKQLETAMNATSHIETPVSATSQGWKYQTAKNASLSDGTPAFYLAAIGLRNDKFTSAAATPDNGVKDIGGTEELEVPLATSVRLTRNGTQQSLIATYTADNGGMAEVAEYTVPFMGFNPIYGVANATDGVEDVLTVDQSFYQTDTDFLKSTLDSRRLATPFGTGQAIALRQNDDLLGLAATVTPLPTLPLYRVRALKLENTKFPASAAPITTPLIIKPVDLDIDAYVYAQEGSWVVIPGDYFRSGATGTTGNIVRSNSTGDATYIDFNNNGSPDTGEYVDADNSGTTGITAGDFADLNRNGIKDPGEAEAVLRLVRYNYKVNFYGAIVENQTAIVADITTPGANIGDPPVIVQAGAVQDWMNKWAAYDSTRAGTAADPKFRFISYAYDPSLLLGSPNANQLRVPVTDDLLYEQ